MDNLSKGRKFNGGISNRNKKITKEERRIKHTKKLSVKAYDEKIVDRHELELHDKQHVEVSAELKYYNRRDPFAPALLEHVYINDVYVDHTWIVFDIKDRRKLKFCYDGCRILLTAVVQKYVKKKDRQIDVKYGLIHVKLKDK